MPSDANEKKIVNEKQICFLDSLVIKNMSFFFQKNSDVFFLQKKHGNVSVKRFLVVQNLKIAESSVFIFSKLFV